MTYDSFTIKAQEAIMQAQQIAAGNEQQSVDTSHLLKGMLETSDDSITFILKKAGVSMSRLRDDLDQLILQIPHVG
ncbi:MAG: Clp protease N-terminal domain-containing protein, partial [Bacteroidota bacterium]